MKHSPAALMAPADVTALLTTAFPDTRSVAERLFGQPPRLRWVAWSHPDGSLRVLLDGWPRYIDRAFHLIRERGGIALADRLPTPYRLRQCVDLTLARQQERVCT